MTVASNDPEATVSPETFIDNLVVMGSIPPVVPPSAIEEARKHHGDAYTDAMVARLRQLNFKVQ